jgi:hypothetical protein
MRLPRMTTRRWMVLIALVALALVAIQMAALLVRDARQKAADERWADAWLREQDDYQERVRAGVE